MLQQLAEAEAKERELKRQEAIKAKAAQRLGVALERDRARKKSVISKFKELGGHPSSQHEAIEEEEPTQLLDAQTEEEIKAAMDLAATLSEPLKA